MSVSVKAKGAVDAEHIKRVKLYVHRDKESNWDMASKLGFDEDSEAAKNFSYTAYEVALVFDVDTRTGDSKLVGADGHFLGDEAISESECIS